MQTDPMCSLGTRTLVRELGEPFAPALGTARTRACGRRAPSVALAKDSLLPGFCGRQPGAPHHCDSESGRRGAAVGKRSCGLRDAVARHSRGKELPGRQGPWQTSLLQLPRQDPTTGGRAIAPGSDEPPDKPLLEDARCWTSELVPRRIVCPVQPSLTGSRQSQKTEKHEREQTSPDGPRVPRPPPAARRQPTHGPAAAPRCPPAARGLAPSPYRGERVRPALPSLPTRPPRGSEPAGAPHARTAQEKEPHPFTLLFPKFPSPSPRPEVRIRQKQWPKTSLFCSVTSQIFIFLVKKQHKNPNVSF